MGLSASYVLSCNVTDFIKPRAFRREQAWVVAWDVFRRQRSRVRGGRSAALVLLVCFECAEVSIFFSFS